MTQFRIIARLFPKKIRSQILVVAYSNLSALLESIKNLTKIRHWEMFSKTREALIKFIKTSQLLTISMLKTLLSQKTLQWAQSTKSKKESRLKLRKIMPSTTTISRWRPFLLRRSQTSVSPVRISRMSSLWFWTVSLLQAKRTNQTK